MGPVSASLQAHLAWPVSPVSSYPVTRTMSPQRGNGRARTFFGDGDYALYRDLLAENCRSGRRQVWAWCLIPNHVHLILVPSDPDGLRRALARVRRAYAGVIQARRKRSVISGRVGPVPSRWTRSTWRRPCAMCRSTRCGRGWCNGAGLAVVEHIGASARQGRRADRAGADQGSLPRFRRPACQRARFPPVRAPARRGEHRPAARR